MVLSSTRVSKSNATWRQPVCVQIYRDLILSSLSMPNHVSVQPLKIQRAHEPQDLCLLHSVSVHRAGYRCHRYHFCRLWHIPCCLASNSCSPAMHQCVLQHSLSVPTFFINCVWVLQFQPFYPWGLTWVSPLHLGLALTCTWVQSTADILIHDLIPRHIQSSQTWRRNILLVLPPTVTLVLRLTEQNLQGKVLFPYLTWPALKEEHNVPLGWILVFLVQIPSKEFKFDDNFGKWIISKRGKRCS